VTAASDKLQGGIEVRDGEIGAHEDLTRRADVNLCCGVDRYNDADRQEV
jgi:hypothetical protein